MKKVAIDHLKLYSKKCKETIRIAFVTDLHNQCKGTQGDHICSMIKDADPDLILCGGDSIVGKPGHDVEPALSFWKKLADTWPIFHAMGNHEYRTRIYPDVYPGMYEAFIPKLREHGVTVLENQDVLWQKGDTRLHVYGFDLDREYYHRWKRPQLPGNVLADQFGTPDADAYTILLAHNPLFMDRYLEWKPDLSLCGHYHGGIWRFGEHRGLLSPDFRLFSGKIRGRFEKEGSVLYIGSGLGEHTLPLRINNPRELVIIDLLPETST